MIKLILAGSTPATIWVNPIHLVEAIERTDHSSNIRLTNGDNYNVQESGSIIHQQMLAFQHRVTP